MEKPAGGSIELPSPEFSERNRVAKFELTKSVEAIKLNKRTLRPLGPEKFTVPYGAVLENLSLDRDVQQFFYLGEPYECAHSEIKTALRELK